MDHTTQSTNAALSVIEVDIGTDTFHLVGFDQRGTVAFRRKIKRLALAETFKAPPPCIVGIEACLSALRRARLAPARTRAAHHPGEVHPPIREGAEERRQ